MHQRNHRKSEFQFFSLKDVLNFPKQWKDYKIKFSKVYINQEEERFRKQIYFERYQIVVEHNKKYKKKLVPFKIDPTDLSDRTESEILKITASVKKGSSLRLTESSNWEKFNKRQKQRYSSQSEEDLAKFFFIMKMHELNKVRDDLHKVGLEGNMKHIDKICKYEVKKRKSS